LDTNAKINVPDFTEKILAPSLIGSKKEQDAFKILSFKK
jgi:hypothetical protein